MRAGAHPSKPGRRMQEVRDYATTTAELVAMAVWLRQDRVRRVVMESTGDYWKGIYYLLEARGLDCWLVNARDVKNLPGRAKTDTLDSIWLARWPSGVCVRGAGGPEPIRRSGTGPGTAAPWSPNGPGDAAGGEANRGRPDHLLGAHRGARGVRAGDDGGVIAGKREPHTLARLARGRAKVKTAQLEEALRGFFTDHHAVMLRMMLDNIDG